MTTPIQNPELHAAFTLLQKANALRDQRQAGYPEVYESALKLINNLHGDDANNLKANIWTNHGIALLTLNNEESLKQALGHFDRAIELRKALPLDQNPVFPWGLAAALMNRADVLSRLDAKTHADEVVRSYDEAIKALSAMPPDSHPSLPSRIALAWMNRGLILESADPAEALRSLNQAVETCESVPPEHRGAAEAHRVLIGALLNRTVVQAATDPTAAWPNAQKTILLTQQIEQRELLAAEIGLRARYLLCRLHTQLQPKEADDWITETTDAVDDGLALARHWYKHGVKSLQPLAQELFRFGLKVYQIWQPHFLSEYILDNLDPERSPGSPVDIHAMHHFATEAIWDAVIAINKHVKGAISTENRAALYETLKELQETETRLGVLREQHLPKSTS